MKKIKKNIFKPKRIFESITTLHGTNQFNWMEGRCLEVWAFTMLVYVLASIGYMCVIWGRYKNDQIITRINANCKVNQAPFPAVSICNFNIVSLKQTKSITRILLNNNRTQVEIEDFYRSIPELTNFGKSIGKLGNFSQIMKILTKHYYTVETMMEEVHQTCEDLLIYCTFNRSPKSCSEMFNLIETYDGYCCTFNYAALNDGNFDDISDDEDIEYYVDPSSIERKATGIVVTSESGRLYKPLHSHIGFVVVALRSNNHLPNILAEKSDCLVGSSQQNLLVLTYLKGHRTYMKGSGLSVVFSVDPSSYPNWSSTPYYGAKILITDPNDYPEITVLYKYVIIGESLDIKVEPEIFQSSDDIRRMPVEKRACIFHDEVALAHTARYSTETCKTECKMRNYAAHCGCIPYKYPSAHTTGDQNTCDPVCYIECRDKKYTITSDVMPLLADFYPPNVTKDRNISELSSLQVYFAKPTCNCYNRELLNDFNYFVATYGGVLSLSFGASIITLFEIMYLLLLLLIKLLRRCTYK